MVPGSPHRRRVRGWTFVWWVGGWVGGWVCMLPPALPTQVSRHPGGNARTRAVRAVNAFNDELDESDARSVGSSQSGNSSSQHMRPRASGAGAGGKLPKRPSAAAQLGGAKSKVVCRQWTCAIVCLFMDGWMGGLDDALHCRPSSFC